MIPDSFLMGPLLFFRSIRILIEGETLLLRLKITWSFDGQKWMNPQFWATENHWIPPIPGLGRLSVHLLIHLQQKKLAMKLSSFHAQIGSSWWVFIP